jgi:hypothetical protein
MKYLIALIFLASCYAPKAPYTKHYVRAKLIRLTDSTAYNPYKNECLILKQDSLYHIN